MKCGEDDDGDPIKVRLETFFHYLENDAQTEDSPLYVFDSCFGETKPEMLHDYSVPDYFAEDLFSMVGDRRRPPHRWFLLGSARSGSSVHQDPLATSAWNTLLHGHKLWFMVSPNAPKPLVKGKQFILPGGDDEAIDYFVHLLPHVLRELKTLPCQVFHFVQYPGETVFVPSMWYHAVLNLDETVAVTQNFVSSVNFAECWLRTREERRKMAVKWKDELQKYRPDLYQLAVNLDETVPYRKPRDSSMAKKRSRHHKNKKEGDSSAL